MAADDWEASPERTWWDTAKDVGQTADDFVRSAANAITFGMADRLAGLTGDGTDAEVAKSAAARERSPVASIAGDVAGSVALPAVGAEALAARAGAYMAPWAARAAGYGASGAATGAAQGAGTTYTGNPADYLRNAATGAGMGLVLGGVGGAAFGNRPGVSGAVPPTAAELRAAKNLDYTALNNNRAQYDARYIADRANLLEHDMRTGTGQSARGRFNERDSPTTWDALGEMRAPSDAAARFQAANPTATGVVPLVDPAGIDFIRKGINSIPRSAERATDRASGRLVIQNLDDFLAAPPAGAVQPGSQAAARVAAALAERARGNNAAYRRVQRIEELADNAQRQAGSTYSGLNFENELRKGAKSFVREKRGVSEATREGYSPAEQQALSNFAEYGNAGGNNPYQNAVRWLAKTAGGGSGLGFLAAAGLGGAGAGYAQDDPKLAAALALPLAGLGLRRYGNVMADRNMQELRNVIARRSPLFTERAAVAPIVPGPGSRPYAAKAMRDAIALEYLKQQQPGAAQGEWGD